jgi:addiction module RelE/StbE family toxin
VRVELSPEAQYDLEAIADYIAADDPRAAEAWVEKLVERARLAAAHPRAGRVVPEWGDADVREVLLRTYRIIYRVEPKRILVLRVIEGRARLRPR